jgi:hypothetical protein
VKVCETDIDCPDTAGDMVDQGFCLVLVLYATDGTRLSDASVFFVSPNNIIDAKIAWDGTKDSNAIYSSLIEHSTNKEYKLKDFKELKKEIEEGLKGTCEFAEE